MKKPETAKVRWDAIFRRLSAWRVELSGADPSVSLVAEQYRHNPWVVLVSTILSLRTKDEVTVAASKRLLEQAPGPAEMAAMKADKVAALAYPAGFYRTKAANLKKIAAILLERYNGEVPSDMNALLGLPGVGRKTANLVLIEAFDLPGICVDIHVHRITNRCGWVSTKNPEETEMTLRKILPQKYWKSINALLVLYGQNLCRPVSPFCSRCVIKDYCARAGIERSR